MINDSVREELASRISPRNSKMVKPDERPSPRQNNELRGKSPVPKHVNPIELSPSPKNVVTSCSNTAEIVIKKTNRTLIDFQKKQNSIPEWRVQLQNVVQQRMKDKKPSAGVRYVQGTANAPAGAVALSSGALMDLESLGIELPVPEDSRLANALKRIEQSRNRYLIKETTASEVARRKEADKNGEKEYPFSLTPTEARPWVPGSDAVSEARSKPTLVPKSRTTSKNLYDTSELEPAFLEAKVSTSFERRPVVESPKTSATVQEKEMAKPPRPPREEIPRESVEEIEETEIFDDVAPFSLRFNSGLFDIIIGTFISLILLAPLMILGGSWFTVAGLFGFLAIFSVVMFIYLTTTIGMYGKSFGMHLFSLEMIDIGGDEYPTFHQAAVSSSVFLLSLAFGGIGFLSSFFDEESRAVHDMVSGTIIVREF